MTPTDIHVTLRAGGLLIAVVPWATPAVAQDLVAVDDAYGVPYDTPLVLEPFGVLENDLLDGESAGESGATAVLVSDVSFGTLSLAADGSFTYSPGAGFDGTDSFVYRAEFESAIDEAVVTLSACEGGPDVYTCWNESAFLAEVTAAGYAVLEEGFEDDDAWGAVRTPARLPSVVSQGIEWRSNHPDPPAENSISTTSGPPRSGLWAVYDPDHGYATGSPSFCDVDDPPESCLYHDGVTGTLVSGAGTLHAVGGYFTGTYGANLGILIDGGAPIGGGHIVGGPHQFFGVVDHRPTGFTTFELRELDGKVGQALYVFGDDFRIGTDTPASVAHPEIVSRITTVSPNPTDHGTRIAFVLSREADVVLGVFDVRGRLVRRLSDMHRGVGRHVVTWDDRGDDGDRVAPGVYVVRVLVADGGDGRASAKLVVLD